MSKWRREHEIDLFFHGTAAWEKIRREGFELEAPRRSDPGDFGWGIYVTKQVGRAKCYGDVICVVIKTGGLAHIENPYFINGLTQFKPRTPLEELYYNLAFENDEPLLFRRKTELRAQTARNIRQGMMQAGYTGITTKYSGCETVIFDPSIIVDAFDMEGNDLE